MKTVYEESFGILPFQKIEGEWNLFLILHKQGSHWGFPKGKAVKGEKGHESATRELFEETHLTVERFLLGEEAISESYSFYRSGEKVQKTVYYFPALVSGAFQLQPEEIQEGGWFSLADAHSRLTFEEARRVLEKIIHTLPFS